MSLSDVATEFKRRSETFRRKAGDRSRGIAHYKQFGDKWFEELAQQVDVQSSVFNEIAGDEARLNSYLHGGPNGSSIEIRLISPLSQEVLYCEINQKIDDLKVEVKLFDGMSENVSDYEVIFSDSTSPREALRRVVIL